MTCFEHEGAIAMLSMICVLQVGLSWERLGGQGARQGVGPIGPSQSALVSPVDFPFPDH